MINAKGVKRYCSEDISLIENYQTAISDQKRIWEIHHRRECDSEGRTLFTCKQLVDMNLYYNRPASELIFVTRSMHWKLHHEIHVKCGKIGGKIGGKSQSKIEKQSIPIIQLTKSGEFINEWPSAHEAEHQLGIPQSNICHCLKGRYKSAGGFVWRYAPGRR